MYRPHRWLAGDEALAGNIAALPNHIERQLPHASFKLCISNALGDTQKHLAPRYCAKSCEPDRLCRHNCFCPPNLFAKVWIKCWRMTAGLVLRRLQGFDQKTIRISPGLRMRTRQPLPDFAHNRC